MPKDNYTTADKLREEAFNDHYHDDRYPSYEEQNRLRPRDVLDLDAIRKRNKP